MGKHFVLYIYNEICCEACGETIHNHIDCPCCHSRYAPTDLFGSVFRTWQLKKGKVTITCESCGVKFKLLNGDDVFEGEKWEDEELLDICEWEITCNSSIK